jgi:hypothetical protein
MKTMFYDLRAAASTVYRITTQSSVYLLAMHQFAGRRTVVVRGSLGSDKENVIIRDTEPRIGEQSLWDVPFAEWVGHALQAGTMTTSRIRAVEVETDEDAVSSVTSVDLAVIPPSRPKQAPPRARPAYPESRVQYAEDAAALLRAIQRESSLFADVGGNPLLQERLRLALTGCAVVLESLREKLRAER